MKCLITIADAVCFTPNNEIEVYIVKSVDQFQYGLAFVSGPKSYTFIYQPKDIRGIIGRIVPNMINGTPTWDIGSTIVIDDKLNRWMESTHIGNINGAEFYSYQQWLIDWLESHRTYSIFDGSTNVKTYLDQSLKYLMDHMTTKSGLILLPKIKTYGLEYGDKYMVGGIIDAKIIIDYYEILQGIDNIEKLLEIINKVGHFYYYDPINQKERYWLLDKCKIVPIYTSIELPNYKPNIDQAQIIIQQPPPPVFQFGQVNPVNPITPDNRNRNGLLVIAILIAIVIIMIVVIIVIVGFASTTTRAAPTITPVPAPIITPV
jgi:hypothetical protein